MSAEKYLTADELKVGMVVALSEAPDAIHFLVVDGDNYPGEQLRLQFFGRGWSRKVPGHGIGTRRLNPADEYLLIVDLWEVYEKVQRGEEIDNAG